MQEIVVYGSDPRMDYVAGYFYNLGFDVYEDLSRKEACMITAPKLSDVEERELLACASSGQRLYYGILSSECLAGLQEKNLICKSYLKMEKLVSENAKLTASGLMHIAKKEAVLPESHCLLFGYGHCGKAIAKVLHEAGAKVDVCIRRKDCLAELEKENFGYVNLLQKFRYSYDKYSYVFNTIPALVLDADMLQLLPDNIMIYDIASYPGGTDFSYCDMHGIRAGLYLGLPGKYYPKEAGVVIASCIYEHEFAT